MEKKTVDAILARLRSNAKCCPNSTAIDRARKGAYVDSIVIIEQMVRQSESDALTKAKGGNHE